MPQVPQFQPVMADSRAPVASTFGPGPNPNLAGIGDAQRAATGTALLDDATSAMRIATDMQDQVNQTQVAASVNKVQEARLKLAYDPDNGYLAVKGGDAVNRPDGISLPDAYAQKLNDTISDVAGNLKNPEQQRLFGMQANNIATAFKGEVEAHAFQEFKTYASSVQDGRIKLSVDEAKRNWFAPDQVDTALSTAQDAVVKSGKLAGKSANVIMADMQSTSSAVHLGVIDAALQANNPTYAISWLQKYRGQLSADDILKATGAVNHSLDVQTVQAGVAQNDQAFAQRFQPQDRSRMNNITAAMESGNKDLNGDGTPVTSPKGAMYRMQVMPDTAANPGFGIRPAADNSPAEYNRVGQEYLGALVKKYGNEAMAWAAYNAGPGKEGTSGFDADGKPLPGLAPALARASKDGNMQNWLSYLPQETQKYVKNGVTQLGSGQGALPLPTEAEYVKGAIATLGDSPRPQQIALMRTAAEHQFSINMKSVAEQGDRATANYLQALIANGGDITAVPLQVSSELNRLAPGKVDDMLKFAANLQKGVNVSDPLLISTLTHYPDEMTKLSDAQWAQYQTKLTQRDFDTFSKQRGALINGSSDDTFKSINTTALTQAMAPRLLGMGLNPTPANTDLASKQKIGSMTGFLRQAILDEQAQTGVKMKAADIINLVDRVFAKDVTFRTTFAGFDTGSTAPAKLMSLGVSDLPAETVAATKASLLKAGNRSPTDDDILQTYRRWKMNQ